MKTIMLVVLLSIACSSKPTFAQTDQAINNSTAEHSFAIVVRNPVNVLRESQLVTIDLASIKAKYPSFNKQAFVVTFKNRELPSQLSAEPSYCVDSVVANSEKIIFVSSFAPREKKKFQIAWRPDTVEVHHYPTMTQAVLGMKVGYKKENGYYTGGRFIDVDSTTVPADHFAHDALYRIEGPGWESDKIVYRFYLDSRNRNDIFGKKTHTLVLKQIGENDLVSNSRESYTTMLDWGMDIFKVGESLGIGSIAMWHDEKAITVSEVDKVECSTFNGPILSGVNTNYSGWKVSEEQYDLFSRLSISAGSRLTKVCAFVNSDSVLLCTGLAKHGGCRLIRSRRSPGTKWAYLALYGKQSLSGDNLGIAVIYRTADEVKLTEDTASEIVVLHPVDGRVLYYFGAAWEEEPNGIKTEKEFRCYLDDTLLKLSNPVQTYF